MIENLTEELQLSTSSTDSYVITNKFLQLADPHNSPAGPCMSAVSFDPPTGSSRSFLQLPQSCDIPHHSRSQRQIHGSWNLQWHRLGQSSSHVELRRNLGRLSFWMVIVWRRLDSQHASENQILEDFRFGVFWARHSSLYVLLHCLRSVCLLFFSYSIGTRSRSCFDDYFCKSPRKCSRLC